MRSKQPAAGGAAASRRCASVHLGARQPLSRSSPGLRPHTASVERRGGTTSPVARAGWRCALASVRGCQSLLLHHSAPRSPARSPPLVPLPSPQTSTRPRRRRSRRSSRRMTAACSSPTRADASRRSSAVLVRALAAKSRTVKRVTMRRRGYAAHRLWHAGCSPPQRGRSLLGGGRSLRGGWRRGVGTVLPTRAALSPLSLFSVRVAGGGTDVCGWALQTRCGVRVKRSREGPEILLFATADRNIKE